MTQSPPSATLFSLLVTFFDPSITLFNLSATLLIHLRHNSSNSHFSYSICSVPKFILTLPSHDVPHTNNTWYFDQDVTLSLRHKQFLYRMSAIQHCQCHSPLSTTLSVCHVTPTALPMPFTTLHNAVHMPYHPNNITNTIHHPSMTPSTHHVTQTTPQTPSTITHDSFHMPCHPNDITNAIHHHNTIYMPCHPNNITNAIHYHP